MMMKWEKRKMILSHCAVALHSISLAVPLLTTLFGSLIRLYFSFTFLHYYWPAWFPAEYHHRLPDPVFLTHVSTHRPAAAGA
jgi:hypothetical protein